MSEKSFIGSNLQIPSGVRWGATCLLADVGNNNCKYLFQVIDQNGDPILARQTVKLHLCTCATAVPTLSANMGPKVPTATEIASSLALPQAIGVVVANAEAVHTIQAGSEDLNGNMHFAYEPDGTAGKIGVHGLIQGFIPTVNGANTYAHFIFETDTEGKFTYHCTATPALTAVVLTLASGKVLFFNNGDA